MDQTPVSLKESIKAGESPSNMYFPYIKLKTKHEDNLDQNIFVISDEKLKF